MYCDVLRCPAGAAATAAASADAYVSVTIFTVVAPMAAAEAAEAAAAGVPDDQTFVSAAAHTFQSGVATHWSHTPSLLGCRLAL